MVDTTATTTNINEEEMSIMFFVFKAVVPGWSLSRQKLRVTLMTIRYLASTFSTLVLFLKI